MFGFSGEHLLVLLVILIIFGPKRLPDLGHSIGRSLKNFKDAMGGNSLDGGQSIPPANQIHHTSAEATKAPEPAVAQAEKIEPK